MNSVIQARIVKKDNLSGEIFHMVLETEIPLQSLPGQFLRLSLPGILDPFIPRPFLIFREHGPVVEIVFNMRGKFTRMLSQMEPGQPLELHGPLGKPFFLPDAESYLLVGGGTGAVFFSRYLQDLQEKRHLFLLGSRNSSTNWFSLFYPAENVLLVTEDASAGLKGTILDYLPKTVRDFKPALILASGPLSLLKGIASLLEDDHTPLWIVLEEMMGCGVGICLSCAITLRGEEGLRKACLCREGLVWKAKEVILPEP
ncbi:MAG: hypothetical protein NUV70_02660 [Caldiserica bacterium]|nr:hypothetical protein [Caldisericota bacterium]